MKLISPSRIRWILLLLTGMVLLILACDLTKDGDANEIISFNRIYDSLAQFDSVQIVMKDTSGYTIDNLYHGKVDSVSE